MQVSLTATGGLERKLEVAVPADQVSAEVDQRLKKIARTARFKGFRPGKAPMGVVRQQYGSQVHSEVVNDLLRSSFADAISQQNLKPATGPRIEPIAMDPGADLKYVATFEVLPEIKLAPVESLAIERPTATVEDSDVEEMLESLRRQRPQFAVVERGAKTGDRVVLDFDGRIDNVAFQGGEGRDMPVVLGAGQVLTEFEQALAGAKAGESRTAVVHFPDDYHGREVAGKTAEFTITVKQVEEASLPALDDAFAAEFGVKEGGVEQLRKEVRESMERELEEAVRNHLRAQVMDALFRENPLEVPQGLVDETVQEMQVEIGRRSGAKDVSQLPPREQFIAPARRRVALGLVVGELLRGAALKVDRARVQARLEDIAGSYPNADEMRRAYLQNADAMRQIESSVLEEQLVDWVVERAKVTDKASSFKELTRFGQNSGS
ncbi:MAG TPA: trigger factor [Steroidobacteraceae bacterium]|nr:trigger factor [Steroidobacteraceae bacterium]HNS28417.1 trigger factor [Steroidobacteraceae bacterium]